MANSKEWWQKYQDALRRGDKEAAAEYFNRYLEAKKAEGKGGSRPTLVSLGYKKGYPNAVPLDKVADEIEKNPTFFELMKKLAGNT